MSGIIIPLKDRSSSEAKAEYYELLQNRLNYFRIVNKMYSRVSMEERTVNGVIGDVSFEKTEMAKRIPERILSYTYYYHAFHKGYQIILCAGFDGEKLGLDILRHIEESAFESAPKNGSDTD